jgi:hypothetical protein
MAAEGILRLETNAAEIARRFERLPKAAQDGVVRGLKRSLLLTEENVRRGAALKFTGSRGGLLSRLTSYARADGVLGLDGAIGFRRRRLFPYELAQEFGAKAKPGKAMPIPVGDRAKAASARGMGPREAFPEGALHLVKGRKNVTLQLTVVGKRIPGGVMNAVQYVLVKSIPPRLHFRENVTKSLPMISEGIVDGWKEGMARV